MDFGELKPSRKVVRPCTVSSILSLSTADCSVLRLFARCKLFNSFAVLSWAIHGEHWWFGTRLTLFPNIKWVAYPQHRAKTTLATSMLGMIILVILFSKIRFDLVLFDDNSSFTPKIWILSLILILQSGMFQVNLISKVAFLTKTNLGQHLKS